MRSIRKSLLQFIFSGAYMRRWNDKLRPVELFELDKQAHKMIVAFLLWQQITRLLLYARLVSRGERLFELGKLL